MRKRLLYKLCILSLCNVSNKPDNYELIYQNIIVDKNVGAPLWLLENESIYPIQIAKIGDYVQDINNLLVPDSYYRFLLSHAAQKYQKDNNLNNFKTSVNAIIQKKNKKILSKLCNKKITFSHKKVKKKIKQIRNYFESIGFLDVKVRAHIVKNHLKKIVSLEYFVKTGDKYKIGDVHFICDSKKLLHVVNKNYIHSLTSGRYVNYEDLKTEQSLLYKFLCNENYWHIGIEKLKFNLCKNKNKKTVDIYIEILASNDIMAQKIKYNTINVHYHYKNKNYISTIKDSQFIKPHILQKAVDIKPGDYYSLQKEEKLYNYFHSIDVFDLVSFQKQQQNNQLDTSLILSLKPKMSISCYNNIIIQYEDVKNSTEVSVKTINLFHTLDVLDIKTSTSFIIYNFQQGLLFKDVTINATPLFYYPFSYIFNSTKISTTIGCMVNICMAPSEKKQRIQYLIQILNWQYQISLSNIFSIYTKIAPCEIIKYKITGEKFINPNVSLTFKIHYKQSFLMSFNCESGLNFKQIINPYLKFIIETIPTIYLSRCTHISIRCQVGTILRRQPHISENILFNIGGVKTLRGWNEGAVGPGDALLVHKKDRLGDMLILLNIENIYKINNYCSINYFFFDIGNIFKLICLYPESYEEDIEKVFVWRNFWKKLHANIGCGIRLNWNSFVVRFDIAFVVYDPTKYPKLGEKYLSFTPNLNLAFGLPFSNVV